MGTANRKATPEEQQQMEGPVEKAMKEGAVGISTGLIWLTFPVLLPIRKK